MGSSIPLEAAGALDRAIVVIVMFSGALGAVVRGAGAIALAVSIPQVVFAATIGFRVTDLPDQVAGEDLWRADYSLLEFPFGANDAFAVEFAPDLYESVQAGEPAPNPDWDVLVLQPDTQLPDSGLYDALALVDMPDTSGPFSAEFVWLGGAGTAPDSQAFTVNRFAPDGTFLETLALGQTFGFAPSRPGRAEAIAIEGEPAPNDGSYSNPRFPQVNDASQVAFGAILEGPAIGSADDYGVFLAEVGSPAVEVAREGREFSVGPLTDTFNDRGEFAIRGSVSGGPDAIFRSSDQGRTLIAQEGQASPDGDGEFSGFRRTCDGSNHCVSINDSSELAFSWDLSNTSSGNPEAAIYVGDEAGARTIVRTGDTEPDGIGIFSGTINVTGNQALNDGGEVIFQGFLVDPVDGSSAGSGIFKGAGGALTTIARTGQPAPQASTFVGCGNPAINNAGQVGFTCAMSGPDGSAVGVFRGSGGDITQIARTGQATPDGNGVFGTQLNQGLLRMNESGRVLFGARISDATPATDTGLFTGDGQDLVQIAREGQAAPDGNGVFFLTGTNVQTILDGNQVGFQGLVTQTAGGSADSEGFFIGDGEEIITAARRGQFIGGKKIRDLEFGETKPMNRFGQVAYRALFEDGTKGVFLFTPDLHWRRSSDSSWDTRDNWTLGFDPALVHDVFIDPDVDLVVSGPEETAAVRNLTVGSGSGTPTLEILLSGTERGTGFGGFDVEDTVALIRGALRISVVDGFVPELGDEFDLAVADRIVGSFDTLSLPELDSGLVWTLNTLVDFEAGRDVLRLAVAVPEPTTVSLLGWGVLSIAAIRRGRRQLQ